jgi:SPP1 family predicted phage head-tail adaptor
MSITKNQKYRTGALDTLAKFQNMGEGTDDGMGGTIPGDWEDAETLWCDLDPLSGKERLVLQKQESTVSHKVTLRYADYDINSQSRMNLNGRIFNLHFIINKGEQSDYMEIAAAEEQ